MRVPPRPSSSSGFSLRKWPAAREHHTGTDSDRSHLPQVRRTYTTTPRVRRIGNVVRLSHPLHARLLEWKHQYSCPTHAQALISVEARRRDDEAYATTRRHENEIDTIRAHVPGAIPNA